MHPHRRRKKRPSYGIRTVEISRGKNGFGFTISGQAPCILSCIITGSPAEKAGLRPGDFLIAVNGQNVSKVLHDDVVQLIGNSNGLLKLQIAENYYSDSSEEEFTSVVKLRPKYPHKVRHRQLQASVSRAEKVVQDLQTGALFVDHMHGIADISEMTSEHVIKSSSVSAADQNRSNKALLDLILKEQRHENSKSSIVQNENLQNYGNLFTRKPASLLNLKKKEKLLKSSSETEHVNSSIWSPGEVFHSIFTEQDLNNILYPTLLSPSVQDEDALCQKRIILKAVVGYLGTIEMPKEPQLPNYRLQTIRNCIRRLRIEKKVHALVLMTVFPESILLINPQGLTLAEFAAEKITFSGVYSDDKKFFGLVTSHEAGCIEMSDNKLEDTITVSSSCHVFMVDPSLTPHHQHIKRAKAFRVTCTSDPITKKCKEFPESADVILQAVVGLYRSRIELTLDAVHDDYHASMSPQPSNTSSNSSNSDSGIGFRDEGNANDRFVIDGYHQYSTNSLDRQAFGIHNYTTSDATFGPYSQSQDASLIGTISVVQNHQWGNKNGPLKSSDCQFDRLTVRAMPDPVGFEKNVENLDSHLNSTSSRTFLQKGMKLIECTLCGKFCQRLCQVTTDAKCLEILGENSEKENVLSSHDMKTKNSSTRVYDSSSPMSVTDICCNSFSCSTIGWPYSDCSSGSSQQESQLYENPDTVEQAEIGSQDVNPPTQDDDSESEKFEADHGLIIATKKWSKTSSLRRYVGRKRSIRNSSHEAGTVSDGELASGKASTSSSLLALDHTSDTSLQSSCTSERPVSVGRVSSWAAGFSLLLDDPAGLHAFSEFLKMEFSQENIAFWIACEHYRLLTDRAELEKAAKSIYSKHLCIGANEPVNVDSHARQIAEEGLEFPTPAIFLPAQKQIFNLMKFDCYQRFLKSPIFKESMLCEMRGQPLPYDTHIFQLADNDAKAKRKTLCEGKKRRSLIPWHKLNRTKSGRSKSSARKLRERHYDGQKILKKAGKSKDCRKADDTSSTHSDITSSRSSLAGSEAGTGGILKKMSSRESLNSVDMDIPPRYCDVSGYCRVVLPDHSVAVVKAQKGETVGEMLLKLLESRCLRYNAVEAYLSSSHQPLDHAIEISELNYEEIRVEQVILFCLDLPNKQTVGVKARGGKMCGEILKPVLHNYGYKMDHINMIIASTRRPVVHNFPVTVIDNQRIIVLESDCIGMSDLEVLTNQIFEDLLKNQPVLSTDNLKMIHLDCNDRNEVKDQENGNGDI